MSLVDRILAEGRMTMKEIDEIRRMFNVIDTDGSGELSPQEIGVLMQKICKGRI